MHTKSYSITTTMEQFQNACKVDRIEVFVALSHSS